MEESICLAELDLLLKKIRQSDNDTKVFQAALKGIDLNGYAENTIEDRRREVERRAKEKQLGFAEVERQEFAGFGINFEEA